MQGPQTTEGKPKPTIKGAEESKVERSHELTALLARPCKDLCRRGHAVIVVESDDKAVKAFDKLAEANVLSAPCRDTSTGMLLGFLDMRDLVSLICLAHDKSDPTEGMSRKKYLEGIMTAGECPRAVSCGSLAKKNCLVACQHTEPLQKAFDLLKRSDLHRVPILDEKGNILDIISESTFMGFLHKHSDSLGDTLAAVLRNIGSSPVISVQQDENTLTALRSMDSEGISGIPVLAQDGSMIDNLRASDLKLFLRHPLPSELDQPVLSFLRRLRKEAYKERAQVVTANETDSLANAVEKMATTQMHRVFVVKEGKNSPTRVISVSDVISVL